MKSTSRRNFIKTTTLAGLSISAGNGLAKPGQATTTDQKGLTFLFQGDSVTDGNRGRSLTDLNHVMGHGYAFAIAARVGADFPNSGYQFFNRGISGNTVADLKGRWQTDTLDLKPDVLSVLVGVNDTNGYLRNITAGDPLDQFETDYRFILSQSRQQNPAVLLVLGLPFVYPGTRTNEHFELWQSSINARALIVKKLAKEFNAVIVNYPSLFAKAMQHAPVNYWIWDGIHPTVAAHELMAREWIKQVGERLRFLKVYRY